MKPLALVVLALVVAGCSSDPAPESAPPAKEKRPPRRTWDDDEVRAIDFPEATTRPEEKKPPAPKAPVRPNVKLALAVYDVISWDDVKIRDQVRGSPVKGTVALTGWLAKAKSASRTETLVAAGGEGLLHVAEPLRALVGGTGDFKVAVLDANEKGELELAVTAELALEDQKVAPATRVRLTAGEALVVGGHRSEEGDSPKVDRLVLIEATTSR